MNLKEQLLISLALDEKRKYMKHNQGTYVKTQNCKPGEKLYPTYKQFKRRA